MHPTETAISAVDLHKTYPRGRGAPPVKALDGLSVEITARSGFALLGPHAAGQVPTGKFLSTLSRADEGTATVAGIDVARHPERVRNAIGLVSQRSSSDPMATGRENLELAGRIQGMSRASAKARAQELLERFELTDAAKRL